MQYQLQTYNSLFHDFEHMYSFRTIVMMCTCYYVLQSLDQAPEFEVNIYYLCFRAHEHFTVIKSAITMF